MASDYLAGLVTLFTDASFCYRTSAAGWGAWAIRDGWRPGKFEGGRIQTARDANDAEIMGIASALLTFSAQECFEGMHTVMVQCDSFRALQVCCYSAGATQSVKEQAFPTITMLTLSDGESRAIDVITAVLAKHQLQFKVRHVKGHKVGGDGRHGVNAQCDALAKHHMRQLQAERDKTGTAIPHALTQKTPPKPKPPARPYGQGKSQKARARRRRREQQGQPA